MERLDSISWLQTFILGERASGTRNSMTMAYCVKCKASREVKNPSKITMKNGKPATTGTCPVCGTKLFRIGG